MDVVEVFHESIPASGLVRADVALVPPAALRRLVPPMVPRPVNKVDSFFLTHLLPHDMTQTD